MPVSQFARIAFIIIFFGGNIFFTHAQNAEKYEFPKDSLARAKLEKWRDQKFGMIIHWGLYSIPGMVESWAICNEEWITRDSTLSYDDYKKWYWGLSKKFNPEKFNPEQWARAAKDAGMKYLVFTTKHHDGFCMFDTKQTDFKISNGIFSNNPKADVAKYVFDAFRKEGLMIGAYFSKPDWHSENYWWSAHATPDRNNNYDIKKFPWRWENFKHYTYNQISELMHDYGTIDILWLDGGWVRPKESINAEVRSWGHISEWSQNIDMPKIAAMARESQPGILIVDRTVHGEFENYRTPEQRIPETKLDYPWESCMTLGSDWGYVPNQKFKTSAEVIHKLIEIVAKGGNLLLGVGPDSQGLLPEEVLARLSEVGSWLNKNGEAIYQTRTIDYFNEKNIFFTKSNVSKKKFSIICLNENETVPSVIEWTINLPKKNSEMICLQTGEKVKWKMERSKVIVSIPASIQKIKNVPALAFSFIN